MSNDAIADETLMLRFIEGDAQAFEALYARHKGGVYRYFTRQCRQAIRGTVPGRLDEAGGEQR